MQCNWFYARTECTTESYIETGDGGGNYSPEPNEWENPFGGGSTSMCAVGYIKDANGNCVPENNPCKDIKKLETNVDLINKLKELKSKINGGEKREYARFIYPENLGLSGLIQGPANTPEMSLNPSSKIDGYMHSHYEGLLSIFSGSDIKAIYDIYKSNKMDSWKTFTALVVTESSTYALKIDDINKFLSFGVNFLDTESKFEGFEFLYNAKISTSNSNTQNEIGLLSLLSGSGLKLFKGNPITFNTWTGIKTNSANTGIINDNCN